MPKHTTALRERLPRWRIVRVRWALVERPVVEQIGYVEAPDEEAAITEAIGAYNINPRWRKSLTAIRVTELD